jgi:hypothetical protein
MQARQGASGSSPHFECDPAWKRCVPGGSCATASAGPRASDQRHIRAGSLGTNWVWPLTIGLCRVFIADDVAHAGMGANRVASGNTGVLLAALAGLGGDWAAPRP